MRMPVHFVLFALMIHACTHAFSEFSSDEGEGKAKNLNASEGGLQKFLNVNGSSNRRFTTVAQKDPDTKDTKQNHFMGCALTKRNKKNYFIQ